jgi:hypothetical protein
VSVLCQHTLWRNVLPLRSRIERQRAGQRIAGRNPRSAAIASKAWLPVQRAAAPRTVRCTLLIWLPQKTPGGAGVGADRIEQDKIDLVSPYSGSLAHLIVS